MLQSNQTETNQTEKLSVEKIIDLVRGVRNDLIKDFLDKKNVELYFNEQYNKSISAVKAEFLIRDLKELLISPVDLVHYAALIKEIRESNSAGLSNGNKDLFYKELEVIFDKYKF
jgi:hypothetical protein